MKKGARCRYTTIQNWSTNVYNLVTQRAVVHEGATMEWVDANLGSKLTMKYPSCYLVGERAHGEILSMAFAGRGQHQDTGGKVIHSAPHTSSKITSKSISVGGGRTSYRGLVKVYKGAHHAKSNVVCDALLIDDKSRSDTYPTIEVIAKVAADLGVRWEELDITRSDSHLREYWDKVPVTLIDGIQHDFWHVSEDRLRAALADVPPGPATGR